MALKFLNDGYFAGKVGIGETNPTEKLENKWPVWQDNFKWPCCSLYKSIG